ncbi:UbiH/UbiF/VisC/COQ6 family ubiquinone biosynthesis hydroxylase [Sphingosinicella sp. CPCC 101087]|uniref:UbiH/UbiF/VisC/COQ6 family ubiquinone biosynthesis hydroxylase n=1 Tax=Sphingosinicella sp. CPCC 101087 TaxID=2497754 RepID=UPI00101C6ECF|nr:UbiH/UbiF/VisC/COQ6 family ubiquinone biosynthesis hydroxylase [Sphingosinicella sp. CPCC 101087]
MERADVIILGGGLVGQTLAIALDRHGLSSIIIDPAEPEAHLAPTHDGRVTAISSSSWRMLQAIGVGDALEGKGCPIGGIRVNDGLKPGAILFEPPPGDDPLGMMFENRLLRAALRERVVAAKRIKLMMPARPGEIVRDGAGARVALDDGRLAEAPLLVGAEGRNSPIRDAAGIPIARWRYDHVAIVATVSHERSHENVAYEIFYPDGPFAILPMLPGDDGRPRSAIVWSVNARDAEAMVDLSERALAHEIARRMGGFLGAVVLAGPRWNYKLGFHHAAQITDRRLALVGDAAHGIHPIAGQGLNLGFRDVAALAEVVVEGARLGMDLGDAQLLDRYQAWRGLDTLMVAFATDSLTRLYGVPGRAASAVRRFGMGAVQRIGPLKDRLMAEARGESGDLPLLLRGLPI